MHWCSQESEALATCLAFAGVGWHLAKHWVGVARAAIARKLYAACDSALLRILFGKPRCSRADAATDELVRWKDG